MQTFGNQSSHPLHMLVVWPRGVSSALEYSNFVAHCLISGEERNVRRCKGPKLGRREELIPPMNIFLPLFQEKGG